MDLGSFPEGQRIPAAALIDMWVELYNLDDQDDEGLNSMATLRELYSLNLVDLEVPRKDATEIEGYYDSHFVMQPNLLRQMVIKECSPDSKGPEQWKRLIVDLSGNQFPDWWSNQKLSIRARLLSITTDETFSPNWSNLQATEVEALVLNCRRKNYKLPEFMKKMDKLKVLIVKNYGFLPAQITNFPLLRSLPNLKRIRLENVSIPPLNLTAVQLEHLRKISLVMCNIGQAFSNIDKQVSSAFPNLTEMNIDCCIDLKNLPVWFCDLVHLKKLCIDSCLQLSELPQEIEKLVNLKVLRLCFCIGLVKLPETIKNLSKLNILEISDCASLVELPEHIGYLHNLRKFLMNGCSKISKLPSTVKSLKSLKDVICDKEAAVLWEPFKPSLKNLKIKVAEVLE